MNTDIFERAILIRQTEETLFRLFEQGKVSGTIHACIGQELSALAFCGQLGPEDFVFSNHRCHGHFLAFTGDHKGLMAEVMGRRSGVCGGVGGSQHLAHRNFFSNGIQGGIMPVAAGMAMAEKLRNTGNIGLVCIGDGTLGQGLVYETANLIAKWELPLLVLLEDNRYAQSTPQDVNLAGDIAARFAAFGIRCAESSTYEPEQLFASARESVAYVREQRRPAFHLVRTYRLCHHSKSDDCRDPAEVEQHRGLDPIEIFAREQPGEYSRLAAKAQEAISRALEEISGDGALGIGEYAPEVPAPEPTPLAAFEPEVSGKRLVGHLNEAFHALMAKHSEVLFLGEDIQSPYGGAFKAAMGLSDVFPERVFTTPISEAAIAGISNGLALRGFRPILEIMFGDFLTLALDQLLNHASKFHHMYNRQACCPVIVRTPMGGHRGYGPTHSQSLEKHFAGMDNVTVLALNTLTPPEALYGAILEQERHPVLVLENKTDYTRRPGHPRTGVFANYVFERRAEPFSPIRIRPRSSAPDVSLVTYGGSLATCLEAAQSLFAEHEILAEIVVLTRLHPLRAGEFTDLIRAPRVFTVEEGSAPFGIGAEIGALLLESGRAPAAFRRIAALGVPIPATKELEAHVLVTPATVVRTVLEVFHAA
jgi:2-oxoisovalerate dehydrogenase E1 component